MSHRNRDASRALAMLCGFSAAGGLVQAQDAPAEDRQLYSRQFNADSRDILEVNGDWTHNLSMYYRPLDNTVVRLAVTNILDADPPLPIGGDSFNGNYDYLGRRYSLSVTYDFGSH